MNRDSHGGPTPPGRRGLAWPVTGLAAVLAVGVLAGGEVAEAPPPVTAGAPADRQPREAGRSEAIRRRAAGAEAGLHLRIRGLVLGPGAEAGWPAGERAQLLLYRTAVGPDPESGVLGRVELHLDQGGRLLWSREYRERRDDPETLRRLLRRALGEAMGLTRQSGPGAELV